MRPTDQLSDNEQTWEAEMMKNDSNIFARTIRNIGDGFNRARLAVWVAGLVILSTLGFVGLGTMYFMLERQNSQLLAKNNTYIELEKTVIALEGRLETMGVLVEQGDKVAVKNLEKNLKNLSNAVADVNKANQVEALQGYIRQIEQAIAKASTLLAIVPLDRKVLTEHLGQASGTIGTLSYIAGKGSDSEWENLLVGKKSSLMVIVALIALSSVIVGLLGLFITRRINRVINDVIRINSAIADGDTGVLIPVAVEKSETGKLYSALRSFRDSVDQRTRMEAERREIEQNTLGQQRKIADLINAFRPSVMHSIEGVTQQIGKMQGAAQTVTGIASQMADHSSNAKSASLESSQSVQSVAMGAEELASSIDQINQQVAETAQIVDAAASNAAATTLKIDGLSQSAQKIGDILSLITDIAEQTNVLALNATIEAARAGEAGKGFAVVASEVKGLAGQSAKAAAEIGSQITEIQSSTGDAVDAIREISAIMGNIDTYTVAISEAMNEQHTATDTISENAHLAASGTQSAELAMSNVSDSVGRNTEAATEVMTAVDEVSSQASDLQNKIDSFLTEVAAA